MKTQCKSLGGICAVEYDGFYLVSSGCIILGVFLYVSVIKPMIRNLQSLDSEAWKVPTLDVKKE
jgi:hypothetical protein